MKPISKARNNGGLFCLPCTRSRWGGHFHLPFVLVIESLFLCSFVVRALANVHFCTLGAGSTALFQGIPAIYGNTVIFDRLARSITNRYRPHVSDFVRFSDVVRPPETVHRIVIAFQIWEASGVFSSFAQASLTSVMSARGLFSKIGR